MNPLKLTSLAALTAATLALPMAASAQAPDTTSSAQSETMKCGAKCGAMHKKMAKHSAKCGAMHKKMARCSAKCGAMHKKMAKCGAKHETMAKCGAKCAAKCGAKN